MLFLLDDAQVPYMMTPVAPTSTPTNESRRSSASRSQRLGPDDLACICVYDKRCDRDFTRATQAFAGRIGVHAEELDGPTPQKLGQYGREHAVAEGQASRREAIFISPRLPMRPAARRRRRGTCHGVHPGPRDVSGGHAIRHHGTASIRRRCYR
jgi:hypothetical protein